jgi:hypothetical protein
MDGYGCLSRTFLPRTIRPCTILPMFVKFPYFSPLNCGVHFIPEKIRSRGNCSRFSPEFIDQVNVCSLFFTHSNTPELHQLMEELVFALPYLAGI